MVEDSIVSYSIFMYCSVVSDWDAVQRFDSRPPPTKSQIPVTMIGPNIVPILAHGHCILYTQLVGALVLDFRIL